MPRREHPPDWMTMAGVAEYLKLSCSTIYEMAQGGEISWSKFAGRWRFFRSEIDAWMFKQRGSLAGRPPVASPRGQRKDVHDA